METLDLNTTFNKGTVLHFLTEQGQTAAANAFAEDQGTLGQISQSEVETWFRRYFPSFRAYSLYRTLEIVNNS
jgi:hypothetical protein